MATKRIHYFQQVPFGLPQGSRLIASSVACRNQGFIYSDRVIGLQFH